MARHSRRVSVLALGASLTWLAAPFPLGTAASRDLHMHPTTIPVRGTQTPVDPAKGTSRLHGGLLGAFAATSFRPLYLSKSRLVAEGTERFRGCVDTDGDLRCTGRDPAGAMTFDYIYWASFHPSTGALIDGRCTHPITGGTGDFSGARGLITMHDVPAGKGIRTTYRGEVVLHAVQPATAEKSNAKAVLTRTTAKITPTC